jgi:hypothetical protein
MFKLNRKSGTLQEGHERQIPGKKKGKNYPHVGM